MYPERSVPYSSIEVQSRFLNRVYAYMAGGLALTALVAFFTASSPAMVQFIFGSKAVFYGLMFVELGLVAWMSGLVGSMSASLASTVFLVYSALNGLTLSYVFLFYTGTSIASVFVVTAGMFGAMSLWGFATKRDLTGLGSFAFMGLIGVVLASLVNVFFMHSERMNLIIAVIGVIVFVGLTAFHTQRLKQMAATVDADSEEGRRGAISGALFLYLAFINLFLMLLRLFGGRRD